MWEQKGTNKISHRAGAWRRIDHALVDHALVARATARCQGHIFIVLKGGVGNF